MWAILRILLLSYGGLALVMFLLQAKFIFPASRHVYRTPESNGWPYEDLNLSVEGETTSAWFLPLEHARGAVLYSHGNGGNLADRLEVLEIFRGLGFEVLAYDYGGYGGSTGKPSERRCYNDGRAMWRYLTEDRRIKPERIVLFGESLGCGVSVQLATEVQPRAVILLSPFLSVAEMARKRMPLLPMRLLVRHKFDNVSKIPQVRCPLLIVHSPTDEIAPYRHGRALFAAANEPKQFLDIQGGHNDGLFASADTFSKGVNEFLTPYLQ
ncbi:MAG: alpha/beta hydrolase [Candidatus Hydrogenedentes bacterium]|nr:alpha/beta hydrolase [Candidatus Hydrogenedentota bacterium]